MAVGLIAALVLVLANGFFVATEFAITRLRPTQVEDFIRQGRPGAKSAKHAVENIDAYLSACQLGITVSSLGLGALGEPAFHDLLEPLLGDEARIFSIGLATIVGFAIITTLHVVVGELSPKSLAIARTEPVSLALSPLMRGFYLVTRPVVDLFNGMGNLLLKPFGVPPANEAGSQPHSEDELRSLLRQSSEQGLIRQDERRLSEAVLLYGDRRVREVMRPRPEVVVMTADQSLAEAGRLAVHSGHTRFPLCAPDLGLDSATGVVNAKDLLEAYVEERAADLKDLSRPIARVSDGTMIDELLRDMRRRRTHMAVVVDEHGTAVGLVTMEDIVEQIVGEIEDEFDEDAEPAVRRHENGWIVDGNASLRLVVEETGLQLEDHHEATVSGHLLERLGRIPDVGETLEIEGRPVEVTQVGEARIEQLRVPAQSPAPDHPSG
ncbi:MAG TPA: hemolysin family protein [Solirubrobacteraceae bacterium]|nr:hemolysin family protein [Solirubrobacteraceae bacterium]